MKLKTKRLILRPIEEKDKESLIQNVNNLEITKWLAVVPYPYTLKDADWWINHCKGKWGEKEIETYEFAIILKETDKYIGGITLAHVKRDSEKSATLGYWIGKDYWKKGYGSEALNAILDFGFNKLGLIRMNASVFVGNPNSGKLLEKFGAKKEGVRRKYGYCKADNKIKDEEMYGLLKEDFKKLK